MMMDMSMYAHVLTSGESEACSKSAGIYCVFMTKNKILSFFINDGFSTAEALYRIQELCQKPTSFRFLQKKNQS